MGYIYENRAHRGCHHTANFPTGGYDDDDDGDDDDKDDDDDDDDDGIYPMERIRYLFIYIYTSWTVFYWVILLYLLLLLHLIQRL